ncbi:MAG: translation initiation factor IF-2 subunit alpha, partial [Thermoplasmata archaeon]
HQKREKIQQWKNEQKAEKLLEMVGERVGKSLEECYEEFGYELIEKFGTLYSAFEEVARNENALKEEGFEGDWIEYFTDVAKENIVIPYVEIKAYVELKCDSGDGIKYIKNALKKIEEVGDEVEISVKYVSAPLYRIEVKAPDYKTAEKKLKEKVNKAIEYIEKHNGRGKFIRDLK